MKLLVTNIQADAENFRQQRRRYRASAPSTYLKEKGKLPLPVPTLLRTTSSTTRTS
jgi:hypothetical protein